MKSQTRGVFLAGMVIILSGLQAHAAGTSCPSLPTNLVADGRLLDFDFVAPGATGVYRADVRGNRSYSIEVRQNYDDTNTDLTVSVVAADCTTPITLTNTAAIEPILAANGFRASYLPNANAAIFIKVAHGNGAGQGRYVSVRVVETTLYSPRWSTFAGYFTGWGFYNNTSSTVHGTLRLFDYLTGALIASVPVNSANAGGDDNGILPGKPAFLFSFSSSVAMPPDRAGTATFTHDGPPGGIMADAYTQSPGQQIYVIKFDPVRGFER